MRGGGYYIIKKDLCDLCGVSTLVQWVSDLTCLCGGTGLIPSPAQWVKDLVLLQLWCRSAAVVLVIKSSSESIPGLGTSICC